MLYASKVDFFFPAIIVCAVYLLTTFFAILEIDKWNIYISGNTFLILIIGLGTYFFVAFFIMGLQRYTRQPLNNTQYLFSNLQDVDTIVMVFLDLISVFITVKYIHEVEQSIGLKWSLIDFSALANMYREMSTSDMQFDGISSISNHGSLFICALSFVCLYVFIIHAINKQKHNVVWYIFRMIPLGCYIICMLSVGSRGGLLQMVVAVVIMYYIVSQSKNLEQGQAQFKQIVKYALLATLILYIFVWLKNVIGRESDYLILDYLAEYIGAPLKNFDTFVNSGNHNTSGIWGKETFPTILRTIGWLTGNTELMNLKLYKEFNVYNGMSLGNVYTAFREYYYDFGIAGVVILSAIHSGLYTTLYLKLRRCSLQTYLNRFNVSLLIFSYISIGLFYFSIDDRLYVAFPSTSNVETMLLIVILAKILTKLKFSINGRTF